ncbi:MAG: hypothetical protein ABIH78_04275, partial [Candidatus Peregrinibacteria bacterium]
HDLGNTQETSNGSGIYLYDLLGAVDGTIIDENIIADNEGHGIFIDSTGEAGGLDFTGGYIRNNVIGQDSSGTATPNIDTSDADDEYGIYVSDAAATVTALALGTSTQKNTLDTSVNYGIYLYEMLGAGITGGFSTVGPYNTYSTPASYTWQYTSATVEQVTSCNDGVDNNADGLIDGADAGCSYSPYTEGDTSGNPAAATTGTQGTVLSVSRYAPAPAPAAETQAPEAPAETPAEVAEEPAAEAQESTEAPESVSQELVDQQHKAATQATKTVSTEVGDVVNTISSAFEGAGSGTEVERVTVDAQKVASAIEEYQKNAEIKQAAQPEAPTEAQKELRNVMTAVIGDGLSAEELAQTQKTVVNEVTQSIDNAISRTLRTTGERSVSLRIDGETVDVSDVNDLEIVFGGAFSEAELARKKIEAISSGKTLVVIDEHTNLDDDGIADVYEISRGLPLFDRNPDLDDYLTVDEIFLGLDPMVADMTPSIAKVTNLDGFVSGNKPSFRIAGNKGQVCDIVLVKGEEEEKTPEEAAQAAISQAKTALSSSRNLFADIIKTLDGTIEGDQVDLGTVTIGEDNKAEITPEKPLKNGIYYVLASCEGEDELGELARFEVNSKEGFSAPKIKLEGFNPDESSNTDETSSAGIVRGVAQPGMTVFVTWKSVILSSVVLSDASQGEFELEIPDDLPAGDHEILVYAVDERNNFISSVSTLIFGR